MIPTVLATIVFVLGYAAIATEHKIHINKAAITLLMAGILWFIAAIAHPDVIEHALADAGSEIFGITVFLLAAMSLVEILIHYRLFDVLRVKIVALGLSEKHQFILLGGLAFLLSGIVDNLTATIIAVQIARKFFWGRNLLVMMVAIVILANAGGAFSPIGDVTTIMLWLAHKFTAMEIITRGFIPSIFIGLTAGALLLPKITREQKKVDMETPSIDVEPFTLTEKIITVVAGLSFFMPIVAKTVHLPPVIGILFGLGLTWTLVELFKSRSNAIGHATASMEQLIQKTDIASIKFFIGILLSVSALHVLGILNYISDFIYGAVPTTMSIIMGNTVIGAVSAVLDNIPLTAIVIEVLGTTDTNLWILLALTVGTGGSLLAIGSAAGVVAMGMNKDLTFKEYVKIGFIPALISYLVGVGIWYAQWKVIPLPYVEEVVSAETMVETETEEVVGH